MVLPRALGKTEVILTYCWDEIIWFLGFKKKTGAAELAIIVRDTLELMDLKVPKHCTIFCIILLVHSLGACT